MRSISIYRSLLHLYPAPHRERFGEEMAAVFGEMESETVSKSAVKRAAFWIREAGGVAMGALQEHLRLWVVMRSGDGSHKGGLRCVPNFVSRRPRLC